VLARRDQDAPALHAWRRRWALHGSRPGRRHRVRCGALGVEPNGGITSAPRRSRRCENQPAVIFRCSRAPGGGATDLEPTDEDQPRVARNERPRASSRRWEGADARDVVLSCPVRAACWPSPGPRSLGREQRLRHRALRRTRASRGPRKGAENQSPARNGTSSTLIELLRLPRHEARRGPLMHCVTRRRRRRHHTTAAPVVNTTRRRRCPVAAPTRVACAASTRPPEP